MDTVYASMTEQELELSLEHAHYCLSIAQTAEQRARWMEQIKQLQQEQRRRTEHVG